MKKPVCPNCEKEMKPVPGEKTYVCKEKDCQDHWFAGPFSIFGGH